MSFTERIETLINKNGITKSQMLKDLKLGVGTFATWEKRGTIPSGEIISKIADYFDVSTDYLLGRDETPKKAAQDEEYDIIETIGSEGEHRIRKVSKSQFDMIDTILKTMSQEQEEFEKKLPK